MPSNARLKSFHAEACATVLGCGRRRIFSTSQPAASAPAFSPDKKHHERFSPPTISAASVSGLGLAHALGEQVSTSEDSRRKWFARLFVRILSVQSA
jgi:hypothetical protein